jgi:predicted aspartyl protease
MMVASQKRELKNAVQLFRCGAFSAAGEVFRDILKSTPEERKALLYAGYTALLENKLKEAQVYLQKALKLAPHSKAARYLLQHVFYRQDDFTNASLLLSPAKRKPLVEKSVYFKDCNVYETDSPARAEISFIIKDPLPLIEISINGAPPINVLIDTGGSEVIIDSEYAKSLGLKEFGRERLLFGGGKTGAVIHSCIDSMQLGGLQVKHLPALLMNTRTLSTALYEDRFRVDGIIGTCLFYHFLTTLDYAGGKIIFETVNDDTEKQLESRLKSAGYEHIPFWMAEAHYMLAKGNINSGEEMLFFIDTGLGGNAFTCPKSTVNKCGLVLSRKGSGYGVGGGGKIKSIPFSIEKLSLGGITEKNLHGIYGPFPPSLEKSFGFKIGGLISHDFFSTHTVIFDYSKMILHIK